MAVQLGLSQSQNPNVSIRHGEDRRVAHRRGCTRGTADRRRRERRRARLRSLIFTALVLALPHELRQRSLKFFGDAERHGPRVSTSIESVVAIPPRRYILATISMMRLRRETQASPSWPSLERANTDIARVPSRFANWVR